MSSPKKKAANSGLVDATKPLHVIYCGVCSRPPEFCEYSGCYDRCLQWTLENCPEVLGGETAVLESIQKLSNEMASKMQTETTLNKSLSSGSDLLAITYAEFDNHVGPQLKFSYPPTVLSKDAFEAISDYVIMGKHLCDRLMLVVLDEFQLLSCSVVFEHKKYQRNSLTFAFGFVLTLTADVDAYGKALKKLVNTFMDMELEYEFLFQPSTKAQLPDILRDMYTQLTLTNTSFLALQGLRPCSAMAAPPAVPIASNSVPNNSHSKDKESNHLNPALPLQQQPQLGSALKHHFVSVQVQRTPTFPLVGRESLCDYDVPIFRGDKITLSQLPWDVSFQHVVMYIDGINHIKKIAREAVMDIDMVRKAIALLVFHGAVIIADIFKFSNVYVLCEGAVGMLADAQLVADLRDFACLGLIQPLNNPSTPNPGSALNSMSKPQHANNANSSGNGNGHGNEFAVTDLNDELPSCTDIIQFFLQLQPSRSIAQILLSLLPGSNSQVSTGPYSFGYANPSAGMSVLGTRMGPMNHQSGNRSRTSSRVESDLQQSANAAQSLGSTVGQSSALASSEEDIAFIADTPPFAAHHKTLTPPPGSATSGSAGGGFIQKLLNVDIVRLLALAQMKGIVRRLHEYPMFLASQGSHGSTQPLQTHVPSPFLLDSPRNQKESVRTGSGLNSAVASNAMLSDSAMPHASSADEVTSSQSHLQQQHLGVHSSSGRTFNRLTSRARTVVGRSFIRDSTTSANTAANSRSGAGKCAVVATPLSIPEIIQKLDGSEHLDSICCKYNLNFHDIISCPGVHIVYK